MGRRRAGVTGPAEETVPKRPASTGSDLHSQCLTGQRPVGPDCPHEHCPVCLGPVCLFLNPWPGSFRWVSQGPSLVPWRPALILGGWLAVSVFLLPTPESHPAPPPHSVHHRLLLHLAPTGSLHGKPRALGCSSTHSTLPHSPGSGPRPFRPDQPPE